MLPQNIVVPPDHSETILSMSTSSWPSSIAADMEHLVPSVDLANSETMTPCPRATKTSAASLPTDKRKKKWRKPKDKPKRPLSAYNLFFQLERQRLLDEGSGDVRTSTSSKGKSDTKSKFGFASLARHIATKWKSLDDDAMVFYQELADKEQVRYMKDLVQWKIHEAQQKYDTDDTSVSSKEQQMPAAPSQANDPEVPPAPLEVSHHEPHQVLSSSWVKTDTASHETSTTAEHQMSALSCVRDNLFGGFDDGTANLGMIIQELAREQQQQQQQQQQGGATTATPAPQQQEMEPLPFTFTLNDFGGGSSNWLEGYQKIAANMFMPPPLSRSLTAFYEDAGITNDNSSAPSSSPSLRQLTMDLSDEEQDFLISSLT